MRPQTETELAGMIREAAGPLWIRGGGTRMPRPVAQDVLDTTALGGIRLYEPGALTLVAGAGTPLAEIDALLAGEGQRLAFEPPDLRRLLGRQGSSTIGGIAAANASGPRRLQVGACRDAMLGLRFVDGSGTVIKNGGRVMKNVTGYDLVKLLAGAHGTLGVLTEVSLRVAPRPETEANLVIEAGNDPAAEMARALGSPFEVSGAALRSDGRILLRVEGFAEQVAYRLTRLQSLFPAGSEVITGAAASAGAWLPIRDALDFAPDPLVLRLAIRPSRLTALRAALHDLSPRLMADWGGGLVWLGLDAAEAGQRRLLQLARAFCAAEGGHATVVKAPEALADLPVFQPEAAPVAVLSLGVRRRFDPRGILNPGLFDAAPHKSGAPGPGLMDA